MPSGAWHTNRSRACRDKFYARLAELEAVCLEPAWLGAHVPHRVSCCQGHDCRPRPSDVNRGKGVCPQCAGNYLGRSEPAFNERLVELGATRLGTAWVNVDTPIHVRCANGHDCWPRPGGVIRGGGVCADCAGNTLATGEARFRLRLAEIGAVLLEPYHGMHSPHRLRCSEGHECSPNPHGVIAGQGPCLICARKDPATAEAAFNARLTEMGAVQVEPTWLGVSSPHHVRCAQGHDCYPRPNNVRSGEGICRECAGLVWDVFYVVVDAACNVKFGISSGDARPRLRAHKRSGYTKVVRLYSNLPDDVALTTERSVKSTLRLADITPIRGREYFGPEALAVVLDIVDGYLATAP